MEVDASPTSVRVGVRVRPLLPLESSETRVLSVLPPSSLSVGGKRFDLDFAFGETATQDQLYSAAVAPLVGHVFEGYNATVFAYGQTGAGKTYTMGSGGRPADEAERGVIPRAVEHVFSLLAAAPVTETWSLHISYLEIHNEEIKDLLHPHAANSRSVSIREDAAGDIFVHGVREIEVTSREEVLKCVHYGSTQRTTGATLMNGASSRSHSLFTMRILRRSDAGSDFVSSKFRLVDLAGSERAKKTGAEGTRFKESVNINQGLLALGNVIAALADTKKRVPVESHHSKPLLDSKSDTLIDAGSKVAHDYQRGSLRSRSARVLGSTTDGAVEGRRPPSGASRHGHIPYRESKLTRLLQDSLGGNSHTLMLACVGPAASNQDESLNTLRYASRARSITNIPVVNRELVPIQQLRAELAQLQLQLLQSQSAASAVVSGVIGTDVAEGLNDGAAVEMKVRAGSAGPRLAWNSSPTTAPKARATRVAAAISGMTAAASTSEEPMPPPQGLDMSCTSRFVKPNMNAAVLLALHRALPPDELRRVMGYLKASGEVGVGEESPSVHELDHPRTPIGRTANLLASPPTIAPTASAASTPGASRLPESATASPSGLSSGQSGALPRTSLGLLKQTIVQWGRSEMKRAQLEQKLLFGLEDAKSVMAGVLDLPNAIDPRVQAVDGATASVDAAQRNGAATHATAAELLSPESDRNDRKAATIKQGESDGDKKASSLWSPAPPDGSPLAALGAAIRRAAQRGQMLQAQAMHQTQLVEEAFLHSGHAAGGGLEASSTSSCMLPASCADVGRDWKRASRVLSGPEAPCGGLEGGFSPTTEAGRLRLALATAERELFETKAKLAEVTSELQTSRGDLQASRSELEPLRLDLQTSQAEMLQLRSELATAKAELVEAKADLRRDEAIFTQKVREIKQLREAHAAMAARIAPPAAQHDQPVTNSCGQADTHEAVSLATLASAPGAMTKAAEPIANTPVVSVATTLRTPSRSSPAGSSSSAVGRPGSEVNMQASPKGTDEHRPVSAPTRLFNENSPSGALVDHLEDLDEVLLGESITCGLGRYQPAKSGISAEGRAEMYFSGSSVIDAVHPSPCRPETSPSQTVAASATQSTSGKHVSSATATNSLLERKSRQVQALQNRLVYLQARRSPASSGQTHAPNLTQSSDNVGSSPSAPDVDHQATSASMTDKKCGGTVHDSQLHQPQPGFDSPPPKINKPVHIETDAITAEGRRIALISHFDGLQGANDTLNSRPSTSSPEPASRTVLPNEATAAVAKVSTDVLETLEERGAMLSKREDALRAREARVAEWEQLHLNDLKKQTQVRSASLSSSTGDQQGSNTSAIDRVSLPHTPPVASPGTYTGAPSQGALTPEAERIWRENFFYKHSNRELKRRLRELGAEAEEERQRRIAAEEAAAAAETCATRLEASSPPLRAIPKGGSDDAETDKRSVDEVQSNSHEEVGATKEASQNIEITYHTNAMTGELRNLRAFMHRHPGAVATKVRVNKTSLRPVDMP